MNELITPEKLAVYKTNYLRFGFTLNPAITLALIEEVERLRGTHSEPVPVVENFPARQLA